ncbi:sodium:solute symporter family protein (plasmid) [Azospirillum oryzae]|uniref:Sodium:solute symporter family protein n=1 Tax=Azospirillum oryzae TaxID=286727 RepID=A0A6N1ARE7_9PROT|nr:sodium:solute symporter family protein [Azospirillum oryzae]KAA0587798.1 sodium:solute symporter family protein [Azospirillum oryzae]QKS53913.1 sodium:solute symporter family protein [Azospirillum oryzae]GLR77698.1 sodium:solute symporter [Azospirillum oryzae]
MGANWTAMSLAIAYILAMGVISYAAKRFANTAHNFTSGGTTYPALLVGFLLMSEFIGTTASVGTAQAAYKWGISAAWNLAALGIGFVFYAFLFARKFKELGENTISGVMAKTYGKGTKLATSIIMIAALQIVAVSVYASGGAVLAGLLKIDRATAIVITGMVAALYVSMGGMRSVIYTNVMHAIVKYIGILVATAFALSQVGGMGELRARLPAEMFAVDTAGWPQIMAWILAGTGAVFSTQYVLQAISTVDNAAKAQRASLYTALLLVPFGLAAALCGMCASLLFPKINALQAFPMIVSQMDSLMAAVVVAGLAGSLFGTISAISIGTATLLYKDFYLPAVHKADAVTAADSRALMFVRIASTVVCLLPIPLAIFAPDVLKVTFLAKSLRLTLAVLVLFIFYAPQFGTPKGALTSILLSLVLTIGWYLAGDPYGIDNAYVALVIPLIVMSVSHLPRLMSSSRTMRDTA